MAFYRFQMTENGMLQRLRGKEGGRNERTTLTGHLRVPGRRPRAQWGQSTCMETMRMLTTDQPDSTYCQAVGIHSSRLIDACSVGWMMAMNSFELIAKHHDVRGTRRSLWVGLLFKSTTILQWHSWQQYKVIPGQCAQHLCQCLWHWGMMFVPACTCNRSREEYTNSSRCGWGKDSQETRWIKGFFHGTRTRLGGWSSNTGKGTLCTRLRSSGWLWESFCFRWVGGIATAFHLSKQIPPLWMADAWFIVV